MISGLPIDAALPALADALLCDRSVVLQAPPGAGKSTVVPLALLEQPWSFGKKIIMLEPRRLAARAVANRMAHTLGQRVGALVGYRMRMDTRVSRDTRIEVVTEGVLTRMLQSDPSLEGVAAVVFDEFHERSLQADLGLALTLDARANLSPDLRIVVMSATLDGAGVARLLGEAPIVTAEGRMFPVEIRYLGRSAPLLPAVSLNTRQQDSPEKVTAQGVLQALREEQGDLLVFLPGAREIRRVQSILQSAGLRATVNVLPLYGDLAGEDQEAALAPSPSGQRKVVLATNIAETSLTIQGVRVIVDSGLVRRSVFDPTTGMSRLETRRIARASAEQRQGRAGRVGPGVCYRMWSEESQRSLAPFTAPEIVEADLAPLALELASWGVRDAKELKWLDEPALPMLASSRELLVKLSALDDAGRITPHGREMARVGVHPRLAHMLLRAAELQSIDLASQLAALLSERDVLRGSGARDADIRSRLELLRNERAPDGVDRVGLQRIRRAAKDLAQQVNALNDAVAVRAASLERRSELDAPGRGRRPELDVGTLLAFAYPDRIGQRRPGNEARYTLANGRGAHFPEVQGIAREELIVAVDLDDRERDASILLAAPLARSAIEEFLSQRVTQSESVEWSSRDQAVLARRTTRLDAIVLDEKPLMRVPPEAARTAMLEGIRELGIEALPWDDDARELQARIEFVRRVEQGSQANADNSAHTLAADSAEARGASWPDVSNPALAASVEGWLGPWLDGVTRRDHLARLRLGDILRALLSWDQQRKLEELAPTHLKVPSGSNIRIDYLDESAPVVSVRLQEVFGLAETPRLARNRVPITFKLLSPAHRPVQVTRDLASFWSRGYAEVRKDLRGRYPKHYWPENPLEAEPTRGVRRRT